MTDRSPTRKRAPRRDAQERREALITAAAATFASQGYSVALEVVAERAGTGRGTLYRNFRDRKALALAIFSREVDRFEAALDSMTPINESLAAMVRDGASAMSLFTRIAAELYQDDADLAEFRALGLRLESIIAPVVAEAQRRGELRATVTARDVVLAMRMAGGLLLPFMSSAELTAQVNVALDLLFAGLRPDRPLPSSRGPAPC